MALARVGIGWLIQFLCYVAVAQKVVTGMIFCNQWIKTEPCVTQLFNFERWSVGNEVKTL